MPSRHLVSPPPHSYQDNHLPPPVAGGVTAAFSCLLLLVLCFRRIIKKPMAPSASDTDSKKPPQRLSYSLLRRATANFSPSLRLGQGGFGSVYRAELKHGRFVLKDPAFTSSHVAVKVMDSGSLQGEREFQNELLFSSKIYCNYIVSVMGFSSNPKKSRMLLVYELMENGSLQDCLFHKKSEELKSWDKRFLIALNIAKGLEYLHHFCDPPIIHGDIKPSNILLDVEFSAKISDFGLARFKAEETNVVVGEVKKESSLGNGLEDTESVITVNGYDDVNDVSDVGSMDKSPESVAVRVEASPEPVFGGELSLESDGAPMVSPGAGLLMDSPYDGFEKTSVSKGFDRFSIDSEGERMGLKKKRTVIEKDYVMEWVGNEIKDTRPKTELSVVAMSSSEVVRKTKRKKKKARALDWWVSLDEEKNVKKEKRRPAREWWKEEYCEELERKNKKHKKKERVKESTNHDYHSENWWPRDDELYLDRKKKRGRSRGRSRSRSRKNSYDSASSTPSMRGTLCYIAPEYGDGVGDDVSEKLDIYSYGVLLLVLIAGRRPLQLTGSPVSEFKRANLLSWARYLARSAKLLDLVDQSVGSLNKEQAILCITVALLCLQKVPSRRPSMKEVVQMLSGDLEPPMLPVELSPPDPSRFTFKNRRKGQ